LLYRNVECGNSVPPWVVGRSLTARERRDGKAAVNCRSPISFGYLWFMSPEGETGVTQKVSEIRVAPAE